MKEKLIYVFLSIFLLISLVSCNTSNNNNISKDQSADNSQDASSEEYVFAKTEESTDEDGKKRIVIYADTIKPIDAEAATKEYFLNLSEYLENVWNEYDVIDIILGESKENSIAKSYTSYYDACQEKYSRSILTKNGKAVSYKYKDKAEDVSNKQANDSIEFAHFSFSLITFLSPDSVIVTGTTPPELSSYQKFYYLNIGDVKITGSPYSGEVIVNLPDGSAFAFSLRGYTDISAIS